MEIKNISTISDPKFKYTHLQVTINKNKLPYQKAIITLEKYGKSRKIFNDIEQGKDLYQLLISKEKDAEEIKSELETINGLEEVKINKATKMLAG